MTHPPSTLDRAVALPRRAPAWLTVVCGVALAAVLVFQVAQINRRITKGHSGDFRHFYYAAQALLDGTDPYTSGTKGYLYPPLIAMLYTPVARLSYDAAQRVMLLVDTGLIAAGLLLAGWAMLDRLTGGNADDRDDAGGARLSPRAVMLSLLPVVALIACMADVDKVRNELQMFQTNALQLALFALALFWLDRRPTLAGVPLGAILNIKYLSLAMVPWLLIRRRWATAISTLASGAAFALLPAVMTSAVAAHQAHVGATTSPSLPPPTQSAIEIGWNRNLHYLSVAYGGLATMVGQGSGTAGPVEQANVEDITNFLSCSLTSSMARMAKFHNRPLTQGLAAAGGIALVVVAAVLLMYRRRSVPAFAWPSMVRQQEGAFPAVIGMEFVAVLMGTLIFSPQTNSRHLCLVTLLTTVAAALLVVGHRRVPRVPVVVATIVMFLTFVLPPGNRYTEAHHWSDLWFGVGGPCWGLLLLVLVVVDDVLLHARASAR